MAALRPRRRRRAVPEDRRADADRPGHHPDRPAGRPSTPSTSPSGWPRAATTATSSARAPRAPTPPSAAGVTWHDVPVVSKRDLRGGSRARAGCGRCAPTSYTSRTGEPAGSAAALAPGAARPRAARTGVVYTLHGVADGLSDLVAGNARAAERRRRDGWYYLTGERAITRWGGGRVVVPSTAVATYAVEHVGLPAGIVDVVPNGVDPARFAGARVRRAVTRSPSGSACWPR